MDLKIIGVGGYSEVGKNMTAIKVGDEYVILDCGFHLPSLVEFDARGGQRKNLTTKGLQKMGAIPDDTILDYISKKNWNDFEILTSNIHSFPPDRLNRYDTSPNYLIYQPYFQDPNLTLYDHGAATTQLEILLHPNDPRIPTNFELLFQSDKTQTVLYKINEPKN